MTKSELNKLCMDKNGSMINVEVRCKHEIILQIDKERVDERSLFILARLVNKTKELEENCEYVKMQLEKLESTNMNSMDIEHSKQEKIHLDEVESLQIWYENININSMDQMDNHLKMQGMKKKKRSCRFFGKFLWCLMICVVVIYVSFLIQVGKLKNNQMK
ncbi:hypothetical protein R3W88_011448 [Solanum pinnatisectum]|uniref:Transmembrane protein n=1 Tax=Solanum pinnatisectum TaxID=50273 RepID=A0AAV9L8M8_9SOLN|nr:hypothetical protein R3W88_011448 [Solanum pinnatisectum]